MFWSGLAQAAFTPLSVSIVPPVQFPPSDFNITGLRVSAIYGQHRDIYGVDLGVIGNITEQDFVGIAASGVFNYTKGQTTILGAQLAGLVNYNVQKTNVYGVQLAVGGNFNSAESTIWGLQLAAVNHSPHTTICGFQIGVYNKAQSVYGFQIGLVNVAEDLHGLQIGLMNFHSKGLFTVAPIINFGF